MHGHGEQLPRCESQDPMNGGQLVEISSLEYLGAIILAEGNPCEEIRDMIELVTADVTRLKVIIILENQHFPLFVLLCGVDV